MTTRPEAGETRYDRMGKIRLMGVIGEHCMVRRPGCSPFVVSVKEWWLLADSPTPDQFTGPVATVHGVKAG